LELLNLSDNVLLDSWSNYFVHIWVDTLFKRCFVWRSSDWNEFLLVILEKNFDVALAWLIYLISDQVASIVSVEELTFDYLRWVFNS
jgi:hypothetical protein